MSNSGLNAAKAKKYDEFYTRRQDIEAELRFYRDEFAGKTVYCNCDDPWESEFVQYFCRNFRELGLRKLMATHYEPNKENHSYSISIDGDSDGDGEVTVADLVKTELVCNGDFRSRECIELLDEADIVVTNPPFSLFREYMAQLIEHDKKFLIIGNKTACKAKEIFPYIKDEKVWLGRSIHSGGTSGTRIVVDSLGTTKCRYISVPMVQTRKNWSGLRYLILPVRSSMLKKAEMLCTMVHLCQMRADSFQNQIVLPQRMTGINL